MEISPVELVKGLLIAGVGVSIIPEISARLELKAGTLIELPLRDAALPAWHIALIRRKHRLAPPGQRGAGRIIDGASGSDDGFLSRDCNPLQLPRLVLRGILTVCTYG